MSSQIKRRIRFAGFIGLLLLCCHIHASFTELQFLTEEYPPLTFSKDGKATGLGSEIVQEIQRRSGNLGPIQIMPWARAYETALHAPNVVLFTTTRTAEREPLFKWVGPIATMTTSLYAKHGSKVHISALNEAKALDGILTVREYYSHQFLKNEGFHNLDLVNTPDIMLNMLMNERRQLMASDNLLLHALLDKQRFKMEDVNLVYTFMESQTYIAFSKDTSDEIVNRWQKILYEMQRDGTFDRLYKKWLPGELPPTIKAFREAVVSQ